MVVPFKKHKELEMPKKPNTKKVAIDALDRTELSDEERLGYEKRQQEYMSERFDDLRQLTHSLDLLIPSEVAYSPFIKLPDYADLMSLYSEAMLDLACLHHYTKTYYKDCDLLLKTVRSDLEKILNNDRKLPEDEQLEQISIRIKLLNIELDLQKIKIFSEYMDSDILNFWSGSYPSYDNPFNDFHGEHPTREKH